jgi:plasmid stability protein
LKTNELETEMPKLRIRDIPEDTFQELERRAALKQISVEDEIRGILEAAALQFCEEEAARASQSARR